MDTTGQRLEKFMQAFGVTRQNLIFQTGISGSQISECINGISWKTGIPQEKLDKIKEKWPQLNMEYMQTGIGHPRLGHSPQEAAIVSEPDIQYIDMAAMHAMQSYIPLLGNQDPKVIASKAYEIAAAMEKVRRERLKAK